MTADGWPNVTEGLPADEALPQLLRLLEESIQGQPLMVVMMVLDGTATEQRWRIFHAIAENDLAASRPALIEDGSKALGRLAHDMREAMP